MALLLRMAEITIWSAWWKLWNILKASSRLYFASSSSEAICCVWDILNRRAAEKRQCQRVGNHIANSWSVVAALFYQHQTPSNDLLAEASLSSHQQHLWPCKFVCLQSKHIFPFSKRERRGLSHCAHRQIHTFTCCVACTTEKSSFGEEDFTLFFWVLGSSSVMLATSDE